MKYCTTLLLLSVCFIKSYAEPLENYGASRCATFNQGLKDKKSAYLQSEFRDLDSLANSYLSPSGNFLIHYIIEGRDGVNPEDKNQNGTPDYVDSVAYYFDYSWQFLVNEQGYISPVSDNGSGSSDAYDIYLIDLGNGTSNETTYGMTCTEEQTSTGYVSYIMIDNDYSSHDSSVYFSTGKKYQTYYVNGIDALKITAIHEFFHAVQFSYCEMTPDIAMLYEMSSVYIEYRAFPEIKYYELYMNQLLEKIPSFPFSNPSADNGYAWSALFVKIYTEYANDAIMLKFWQNINSGQYAYDALNSALIEYTGKDLQNHLAEIASWFYYTGKRAQQGKFFTFADELSTMKFDFEDEYSYPSVMISGDLLPLAFYPARVIFRSEDESISNDTLDVIVYNAEYPNSRIYQQKSKEFCISMEKNSSECDTEFFGNICFNSVLNKDVMIPIFFAKNGSRLTENDLAFPNPYSGKEDFIAFPVPFDSRVLGKAKLAIYDTDNTLIYEDVNATIDVIDSKKVVAWRDISRDIPTGVYFYKVTINNDSNYGKFVIKRSIK